VVAAVGNPFANSTHFQQHFVFIIPSSHFSPTYRIMATHTRKKPTTTKRVPAKAVVPGRKKVKTRSTGAPAPRVSISPGSVGTVRGQTQASSQKKTRPLPGSDSITVYTEGSVLGDVSSVRSPLSFFFFYFWHFWAFIYIL
jgi:hypothetical protein